MASPAGTPNPNRPPSRRPPHFCVQLVGLLSTPKSGGQETMVTKNVSPSSTWSISSAGSGNCWPGSPADSEQTSRSGSPGTGSKRTIFGCSKFAMDKAAQGGHLEVLKLLHTQVDGGRNFLGKGLPVCAVCPPHSSFVLCS